MTTTENLDLGQMIEGLELAGQKKFRQGHRLPIRKLFGRCPNPQVEPFSEKIEHDGIRTRVDVCRTCGQTHETYDRVLHSGL